MSWCASSASFERLFGRYLPQLKWVNFGGGHHITRDDYDLDLLCETITAFRRRHNNIQVYLEPGEAVVLNGGVFVTTVLDTIRHGMDIAILDCSAETHMPDVLAMPYRPHIIGAGDRRRTAPYLAARRHLLSGRRRDRRIFLPGTAADR